LARTTSIDLRCPATAGAAIQSVMEAVSMMTNCGW
jgi:hypothetical protein